MWVVFVLFVNSNWTTAAVTGEAIVRFMKATSNRGEKLELVLVLLPTASSGGCDLFFDTLSHSEHRMTRIVAYIYFMRIKTFQICNTTRSLAGGCSNRALHLVWPAHWDTQNQRAKPAYAHEALYAAKAAGRICIMLKAA